MYFWPSAIAAEIVLLTVAMIDGIMRVYLELRGIYLMFNLIYDHYMIKTDIWVSDSMSILFQCYSVPDL